MWSPDHCVISHQSSVVLLERQRLECPPLISVQFALVQIVLITSSIYAKIKGFSLCVCVSECSDARQTDLQGWGWSYISSHLQTWRRPETRSAHPADHLAHGQSKKCSLTDGNAPRKLKTMFFCLKKIFFLAHHWRETKSKIIFISQESVSVCIIIFFCLKAVKKREFGPEADTL